MSSSRHRAALLSKLPQPSTVPGGGSRSRRPERPDLDPDTTAARSRLSPEREGELYAATLALLAEEGYERLSMDAVAQRAHTSKATIYRQWHGKAGLVVAALRHVKDPDEPLPDTGSLRGDLLAVARSLGTMAVQDGRIFAAASHAVLVDADVAAAVRARIVAPGVAKLAGLLERAVARGEVAAGHPALARVPELIVATFLARPLLEGVPADERYLADLVEAVVLPAVTAPPAPSTPSDLPQPPRRPRDHTRP